MQSEGQKPIRRILIATVIILVVTYLIALFVPGRATSTTDTTYNFNLTPMTESLPPYPQIDKNAPDANIDSQVSILVDDQSGEVIYSNNGNQLVPIASTTKLMTALVVRDKLSLDQVIEVTSEHTSVIGSDMALRPGEKMTVGNLLTGLLVVSGNDASWALAEAASGSREAFINDMNAKVKAMGLKVTHYADPAGLEPETQSTAFELATIARAVLRDDFLASIVRRPEIRITSTNGLVVHDLKNSNRLVNEYAYLGAIGLKTGYTSEAGHCLVAAADRNGHRLIAVILHTNSETITASADEARKLLDWGWTNVSWK